MRSPATVTPLAPPGTARGPRASVAPATGLDLLDLDALAPRALIAARQERLAADGPARRFVLGIVAPLSGGPAAEAGVLAGRPFGRAHAFAGHRFPMQQTTPRTTLEEMQALKARVHNGRLVLDEPTDLPEGEVVYLVPADAGDELDDEERAALHAEIDASIAEVNAGHLIDADVVMAELRARS